MSNGVRLLSIDISLKVVVNSDVIEPRDIISLQLSRRASQVVNGTEIFYGNEPDGVISSTYELRKRRLSSYSTH
jgi:hypothetical protein